MDKPAQLPAVAPLGGRIASLDGLRALSILLVLVGHVRVTSGIAFGVRRWATAIPGNASLGVSVFFVISGFLITHLLLREQQKTGQISLRGFYVRRFFRIMPAYYSFLLVIVLIRHFGPWFFGPGAQVHPHDIASAGFFFTDYAPYRTPEWVGHTWSLSVEEQFYLFWPMLLSLIGRRRAGFAAIALIVAAPIGRIATWFLVPHDSLFWQRIPFMLHTRVDSLMFGCAVALYYQSPRFQSAMQWAFARRLHIAAFIFAFFISPYLEVWSEPARQMVAPPAKYLTFAGFSLEGACVALLLVWAVQHARHPVGRLLNWRPIVHLGLISYSLYLWQQLFLLGNPTWTGKFGVNILCAFAVAECSYFLIERPFLRLRDRLTGARRYEKPVALPLTAQA